MAVFMIDADMNNILLPGNIVDDLGDVFPDIGHHAVVGTKLDGIAETVSFDHGIMHDVLLDVADAEIGQGAHAKKKNGPNPKNEINEKTMTAGKNSFHSFTPQRQSLFSKTDKLQ